MPTQRSRELAREDAQRLMKNNERNFGAHDVPAIMAGFTEDVVVRYADFPEMRGKDALEKFLRARFSRMLDYRLVKTLDVVDRDTVVNSWTGTWRDAKTEKFMEGRGIEVWRVTDDDRCDFWSAVFNVWEMGRDSQLPIV